MQLSALLLAAVAAVIVALLLLLRRLHSSSSGGGAIRVSEIYIYPVKSCGGLSLQSSSFTRQGFRFDRQWMIVNADTGNMVTAREIPHLVRVLPKIDEGADTLTLRCDLPGLELQPLVLPLHPSSDAASASVQTQIPVLVWDERLPALHCGPAAAAWVTAVAAWIAPGSAAATATAATATARRKASYALVAVLPPDQHDRPLKAKYDWTTVPSASAASADAAASASAKETQSSAGGFSDAFPFLLASHASLRALNKWTERNGRTMEMESFRPNIVVDGPGLALQAWEEDWWRIIRIRPASAADAASDSTTASSSSFSDFSVAKPCSRCILTTVIPCTGMRHPSGEPLLSLRAHRMILPQRAGKEAEVYFAQNLANLTRRGTVRVGDVVQIMQRKPTRYEEIPKSNGSEAIAREKTKAQ